MTLYIDVDDEIRTRFGNKKVTGEEELAVRKALMLARIKSESETDSVKKDEPAKTSDEEPLPP